MLDHTQAAPGDLEIVRRFLNTWSIPNDTRVATDALPALLTDPHAWRTRLSTHARHRRDSPARLRKLRADLRASCEDADAGPLNDWLARAALSVTIRSESGTSALRVEPADATFVALLLASVANAVSAKEWPRLKTCPDCRWAFYDATRNASKRWCGMTKGGPDGRACGTIAKVKAYRARQSTQRAESATRECREGTAASKTRRIKKSP